MKLKRPLQALLRPVARRVVYPLVRRLIQRSACNLGRWFYQCLEKQQAWSHLPRNCYFEFGTGWGDSMAAFAAEAVEFCRYHQLPIGEIQIVGFDSFQGLPSPQAGDAHPQWTQGMYSHTKDEVLRRVAATGFPLENVLLIEGFYEQSLSPLTFEKIKHLRPAIINIDCDYYSSSKLALEFVAPLLRSGAMFYFDDIFAYCGHPDMGELKAIREFQGKHGFLTRFDAYGLPGQSFIYSALTWEHTSSEQA